MCTPHRAEDLLQFWAPTMMVMMWGSSECVFAASNPSTTRFATRVFLAVLIPTCTFGGFFWRRHEALWLSSLRHGPLMNLLSALMNCEGAFDVGDVAQPGFLSTYLCMFRYGCQQYKYRGHIVDFQWHVRSVCSVDMMAVRSRNSIE